MIPQETTVSHDEDIDGADLSEQMSDPESDGSVDGFFGAYFVLSPGVEIVLDGRPVSARSDG